MTDGKASKERDLLKEELDATKAKLDQLQQQTTQMMRDRTAVNNELSALKDELATKVGVGRYEPVWKYEQPALPMNNLPYLS